MYVAFSLFMDMLIISNFHFCNLTIKIQVYTYLLMTITNNWNFWIEKYEFLILIEIGNLFSNMIKVWILGFWASF